MAQSTAANKEIYLYKHHILCHGHKNYDRGSMSKQDAVKPQKDGPDYRFPHATIDGIQIGYPLRDTRENLKVIKTTLQSEDGLRVVEIYTNDTHGSGHFNVPFLLSLTGNQRHFLVTEVNRLRSKPTINRKHDDEQIQDHTILQRGMVIEKDARGKIMSAHVPAPFIIDQLLEHGVIDREQHWHAEQFVAMRKVFLRPVETIKTVMTYQSEPDAQPPAKYPIADNDYLIVLRDMRHEWHKRIVTVAIETEFNLSALEQLIFADDPEAQATKQNQVSNAFWSLTYAINRLLDKKKEAEDAKKVVARSEDSCESLRD